MADRRAEDTPLAPRRTLGGPGRSASDDTADAAAEDSADVATDATIDGSAPEED
jgi:hypothetical protein